MPKRKAKAKAKTDVPATPLDAAIEDPSTPPPSEKTPWVDICPRCDAKRNELRQIPQSAIGSKTQGRIRCSRCGAFELAMNVKWKD